MSHYHLRNKVFRVYVDPKTGDLKDSCDAVDHTFDNMDALKGYVEQIIACQEANVKAGAYKDLRVGEWQQSGEFLVRDVTVTEETPNYPRTLITHRFVAHEERPRF